MAKNSARYRAYLLRVIHDEQGKPRYIRLQDIQDSTPALYFHDAERLAAYVWSDANNQPDELFGQESNPCDED